MNEFPNDRQRAAIIRIADALMKGRENPAEANGDRLAYALERIASWCEAANIAWDPMAPTGD